MPDRQTDMETKATKYLKGNAVQFYGTARIYEVGIPSVRVTVAESKTEMRAFRCECMESNQWIEPGEIIDRGCAHIAAAVTFDHDLMIEVKRRVEGQ